MNVMHRTAGGIAKRVLGKDTPENRRVVTRWSCEVPPESRPFPIRKDGRTIYVWESDIANAGAQERRPGSSNTDAAP